MAPYPEIAIECTDCTPREREQIRLHVKRLADVLSGSTPHQTRVTGGDRVAAGTPVAEAHQWWKQETFDSVPTPPGFPRQPRDTLCPSGIRRFAVEVVNRRSGGMGSIYGFEGHFCSILFDNANGLHWDVRSEPAT